MSFRSGGTLFGSGRNLNGLIKAIENNENACIEFTSKCYNPLDNAWIIYHKNGTNILISDNEYQKIKNHLIKV